jgi:alpha-beta hydrolase superfamily lysophospholipase
MDDALRALPGIAADLFAEWFKIAHGLGEQIGRYAGFIEHLVQTGLVVYGNDHRGHGRTATSPENFGEFGPAGFNLLAEDMAQLTAIAKEEHPEVPFILLGHSMGSFARGNS